MRLSLHARINGLVCLGVSDVALLLLLCAGLFRFITGAALFTLRRLCYATLLGLTDREADRNACCGKESNHDERPGHDAAAVAAHELPEFVSRAGRARQDRLVGQVSPDI